MVDKRIKEIQVLMLVNNIDMYYVNTSDYHNSEYLGEYFKTRVFLTGFTGSQGTVVITKDSAYLWVDGRYFIQAENQIEGTCINLMKMGQDKVPTVSEFIKNNNGNLGLDGKCSNIEFVNGLKTQGINIIDIDLVTGIWLNRPMMANSKVFELDVKYSGKSRKDKLDDLIKQLNGNVHVINSLDQICWLLNIRANDIAHTPVVLSYIVIEEDKINFFVDQDKLGQEVRTSLLNDGILISDYEYFYEYLLSIRKTIVLMDYRKNNYASYQNLVENNEIIDFTSPIDLAKAIKNEVEINNTKNAHIKDGLAMVNFIYNLKHLDGEKINEYEVSEMIAKLRIDNGAIDLSFSTIAAFKENAAMMHYTATKDDAKKINGSGLLLVDSGGHYLEGTTDITRTILIGEASKRYRKLYTKVLKSNVDLASAKFLYGCSGLSLDILARNPIWQMDLDYQCGTGHGVGYLLGVHEGPQAFRWKKSPLRNEDQVLEAGMIITDEPGIYLKDELGIRIENELLCKKGNKNEYGQFMEFEEITYCPYDRDLINTKYLSIEEISFVNKYNSLVYNTLKDYLSKDVKKWLKKECEEL
jgi:Xaa-Pro aminopeptidase